jgi:hypothetical protein
MAYFNTTKLPHKHIQTHAHIHTHKHRNTRARVHTTTTTTTQKQNTQTINLQQRNMIKAGYSHCILEPLRKILLYKVKPTQLTTQCLKTYILPQETSQ